MNKLEVLAKFLYEPEPWKDEAACRSSDGQNVDYFFPTRGKSKRIALAMCAACPVRVECEEYSNRTNSEYGVWAGKIKKRTRTNPDESETEPMCQSL